MWKLRAGKESKVIPRLSAREPGWQVEPLTTTENTGKEQVGTGYTISVEAALECPAAGNL